ncbi:MAG: hypothetical protein ACFFDN_43455 [Candidatus Hodarchaeota archaeon]
MSKLKGKNIILFGIVIGLLFSSLPQIVPFGFDHRNNRNNNLKIKTNGLNESWNFSFDFFGLDMVIDFNNCIYIMTAEDYYSGPGPGYYGDLIILRYNSTGDQLWSFHLEGLRSEYSAIVVDSKSNLYLASMYENETIVPNMILFKFNSSGDLKWQKTWDGGINGYIVDIDVDSNDNIYIYGTSDLAESFKFDLFIAKYNSSGDQQWFHLYGEAEGDYDGWDMEIDLNSNVIVSGYYHLQEDFLNWIRCYNQSGQLKWEIISEQGGFYTLAVDSSDNLIVGRKSDIAKYDNSGSFIWSLNHQIEFYWAIKIAFDSSDNIYVGAGISIPADHHAYDLYVVKINSSGDFEWYLTWGGSGDEDLIAIDIDSNKNIYLLSDHLLIKNPEHNGKLLTNEELWMFYLFFFGICILISTISLFLILKRKAKQRSINEISQS